jgi:hypothetical protein
VTPTPNPPAGPPGRGEPIWKGMTPEEQHAYVRDLCRIENERKRAQYAAEERRLKFVRPVYTGGNQ